MHAQLTRNDYERAANLWRTGTEEAKTRALTDAHLSDSKSISDINRMVEEGEDLPDALVSLIRRWRGD